MPRERAKYMDHPLFKRQNQRDSVLVNGKAYQPRQVKSFGRELRSKDFGAWLKYHFSEVLTLEPPPHQKSWIENETAKRDVRGRHEWTCAFRGSSKSTIMAVLLCVWRICEKLENYIVWISYTQEESQSRKDQVMEILENHKTIIEDYGQLAPKKKMGAWSRRQAKTTSGIILANYGINSVPRGLLKSHKRPSLILNDDISGEKNQQTPLQREKLLNRFDDVILKLGPPDGSCNFICITTPNHPEGIESIIKNRASWIYKEWPGLLSESTSYELWDKFRRIYLDLKLGDTRIDTARTFYADNRTEMDIGAKVAWPEMRNHGYVDYYMQRLDKPGSFAKEIGLPPPIGFRPIDPASQKLNTETCQLFRISSGKIIITRGDRLGEEIDLDDIRDFGFLDPAVGEKKTGDFAAVVRVGVDRYGYKYLLSVWCEIANKSAYLDAIVDMQESRPFTLFGFEGNGFQRYLRDEWEAIEQKRLSATKMDTMIIYNQEKKLPRIVSAIQAPMANHHLAINEHIYYSKPTVWSQFVNLGTADHEDAPDALASCLQMITRNN